MVSCSPREEAPPKHSWLEALDLEAVDLEALDLEALDLAALALPQSVFGVRSRGGSYLSQSNVRFLNEVLQTATECSGQQQIRRLPQHVIYLRRAEQEEEDRNTSVLSASRASKDGVVLKPGYV